MNTKTKPNFEKEILLIAICLTFFACSSGGSGSFTYTCQLVTSCIQLESVSDCNVAGGSVVDVCSFNSDGFSSSGGVKNSSSSSSNGSNGGGYSGSYGSFIYVGQTYKTVVIGTQTWMAENLNYNVSGSKCYDDDDANCATYGRLYDRATAMTVCPNGWHLPTNAEWTTLIDYVGGSWYLKATIGWNGNGNGEDNYGFAAMPGGESEYGYFNGVGYCGYWWSTSKDNENNNIYIGICYNTSYYGASNKSYLFSVRCLKDE